MIWYKMICTTLGMLVIAALLIATWLVITLLSTFAVGLIIISLANICGLVYVSYVIGDVLVERIMDV